MRLVVDKIRAKFCHGIATEEVSYRKRLCREQERIVEAIEDAFFHKIGHGSMSLSHEAETGLLEGICNVSVKHQRMAGY